MSDPRAIIIELLRNIGGRKEVEQYLRHYTAVDRQRFAVIAISRQVLDDRRRTVAAALSFLHQVGLYPIVVHAAGPYLDEQLVEAGLGDEVGGKAWSPRALEIIRRAYQQENLSLVEDLEAQGCAARPIAAGVLEAEPHKPGQLFGRVTGVDQSALSSAIRARQLPIVASLAASPSGQILDVDPEDAAVEVARAVEPHKLIVLSGRGGLLDRQGHLVSAVNLAEDAARLPPLLEDEDRERLARLVPLLEELDDSASVSITSPDHLARELFTHRGSGTLVRRGERVVSYDHFDELDRDRLRDLVESCFGRRLEPGYFDKRQAHRIYVSDDYRATAILTQEEGMAYLDKFAVTPKAQGEGIGGSVWGRMRRDHARLFWRSRADNEVNGWYFSQADGSFKSGHWNVFWYGYDTFEEARRCVEVALSLPASLAEAKT
ncbi:MAG: acetylglutamate kinase [Myxococcales bacterium]|nr:acetylglutamate kinase [Myxococcales bacterium]